MVESSRSLCSALRRHRIFLGFPSSAADRNGRTASPRAARLEDLELSKGRVDWGRAKEDPAVGVSEVLRPILNAWHLVRPLQARFTTELYTNASAVRKLANPTPQAEVHSSFQILEHGVAHSKLPRSESFKAEESVDSGLQSWQCRLCGLNVHETFPAVLP